MIFPPSMIAESMLWAISASLLCPSWSIFAQFIPKLIYDIYYMMLVFSKYFFKGEAQLAVE